jgi:hypothetical protein
MDQNQMHAIATIVHGAFVRCPYHDPCCPASEHWLREHEPETMAVLDSLSPDERDALTAYVHAHADQFRRPDGVKRIRGEIEIPEDATREDISDGIKRMAEEAIGRRGNLSAKYITDDDGYVIGVKLQRLPS